MRNNNIYINISLIKDYFRNQINFIDNKDGKKQIKSMCNKRSFPFIYNGIVDRNPNASYDIKQFQKNLFIIAKFSNYAINF